MSAQVYMCQWRPGDNLGCFSLGNISLVFEYSSLIGLYPIKSQGDWPVTLRDPPVPASAISALKL